jgi:hypothetical protein
MTRRMRHTTGNFNTIGDQDFFEHEQLSLLNKQDKQHKARHYKGYKLRVLNQTYSRINVG